MELPSPKVVIASLPGSGTHYMAAILDKLLPDISVGHECIFGYRGVNYAPTHLPAVEISGFCSKHLPNLLRDTVVIHQVRNPIDQINTCFRNYSKTLFDKGFLKDEYVGTYHGGYLEEYLCDMNMTHNEIIEESDFTKFRFRVEDEVGPDLVEAICREAGFSFSLDEVGHAIASTPKNLNSNRNGKKDLIFIEELPTRIRGDLEKITEEYGY